MLVIFYVKLFLLVRANPCERKRSIGLFPPRKNDGVLPSRSWWSEFNVS